MAPSKSPYCSRATLESMKLSAGRAADALPIEEPMLLWTPQEAKAYFDGNGPPDPAVVATRSPSDKAAPLDKVGPRQAKQDLIFTICCPCCDMLIADQLDKRAKRKAQSGGSPPCAQAMSR